MNVFCSLVCARVCGIVFSVSEMARTASSDEQVRKVLVVARRFQRIQPPPCYLFCNRCCRSGVHLYNPAEEGNNYCEVCYWRGGNGDVVIILQCDKMS